MNRTLAVSLVMLAAPAVAQDMEVMGSVKAEINGHNVSLWVPYFTERQEAYATLSGSGIMANLSVDSFAGVPGESVGRPRMVFQLMRPGPNAVASGMSFFPADEPGRMYQAEEGIGTFEIGTSSMDGNTVIFDFTATTVPTDTTNYEPIAGAPPVEISGRVEVVLRGE